MAKKMTKKTATKKTQARKAPAKKKATCRKPRTEDQSSPEMDLPESAPVETKSDDKPVEKKMSGITAAAKLLAEEGRSMNVREITETIIECDWWNPGGKTPINTLYAAIITEIKKKGDDSRFRRAEERGKFEINS